MAFGSPLLPGCFGSSIEGLDVPLRVVEQAVDLTEHDLKVVLVNQSPFAQLQEAMHSNVGKSAGWVAHTNGRAMVRVRVLA